MVNLDTVPDLDCLVSCILEWAHTLSDEKWSITRPGLEYRVQVSEWLLHSSKGRLLVQSDGQGCSRASVDPHHASPFQRSRPSGCQRPESKMDRNARRKERQKIHKAQAASGTSAPTTPPKSAPASDKGKSKAKGKRETSTDAGKGKSKSKGDSHREKGKARDTHYGKGKGQK